MSPSFLSNAGMPYREPVVHTHDQLNFIGPERAYTRTAMNLPVPVNMFLPPVQPFVNQQHLPPGWCSFLFVSHQLFSYLLLSVCLSVHQLVNSLGTIPCQPLKRRVLVSCFVQVCLICQPLLDTLSSFQWLVYGLCFLPLVCQIFLKIAALAPW